MVSAVTLVHLGDATLMIPVAGAIALFLALNHAWRLSLWWTASFGAALALVIASKIAYIGWGIGIAPLEYKALSGHAMLTAAVLPTMFHVIFWKQAATVRHAGIAIGFALAALVSALVVAYDFHSRAEAIAGSALGIAVSFPFLRVAAGACNSVRLRPWKSCASATMLLLALQIPSMPSQYWMTCIAVSLSGQAAPYSWRSSEG